MSEVAAGKPVPNEQAESILHALDRLSDGELHEVVRRCGEILAAREKDRREEALKEIQRIAREHGLNVDVKEPHIKRRKGPKPKK